MSSFVENSLNNLLKVNIILIKWVEEIKKKNFKLNYLKNIKCSFLKCLRKTPAQKSKKRNSLKIKNLLFTTKPLLNRLIQFFFLLWNNFTK